MAGTPVRTLREENSRTALTALAGNSSDDGSDYDKHNTNWWPQFYAAFLATLAAMSAGTIMGWTSPALPLLKGDDSPFSMTPEEESWIGAIVNLGALLGAAPAGFLAHRIGRQRLLTILALPLLASWIQVAIGRSLMVVYGARFLGGLAAGAISAVAPIYTAEIAEQRCRGALGTLFQLQLTIGILFVYVMGAVAPLRCISYACAVIPAFFLATFVWMPETPQFLLSRGRRRAAEKALQWLRGGSADVQKELLNMQSAIQEAEASTVSYKAALKSMVTERATCKALAIALGLMAFQQLSGINAVIFYSGSIFEAAGGVLTPQEACIVVGVVQVLACLCSFVLVDRAGRKPLLLISTFVMAVCLAALATSFSVEERSEWLEWLPVVSVAVYIIVFSIGFGPIPWMMMGELFSPNAKSTASAMVACFNWILAFVVTKGFQNVVDILGITVCFYLFAGVCTCGIFFVYFVVPETKGKSLDDIQSELATPRAFAISLA